MNEKNFGLRLIKMISASWNIYSVSYGNSNVINAKFIFRRKNKVNLIYTVLYMFENKNIMNVKNLEFVIS